MRLWLYILVVVTRIVLEDQDLMVKEERKQGNKLITFNRGVNKHIYCT